MPSSVRVRVPATSANLGPGFDTLGVALRLANTVTVRRAGAASTDPMAAEAAEAFFAAARKKPFAFAWDIRGDVPRSRGLGSSVTVRLGLLHGLNRLAGAPLDDERLYRLCAQLEGHPDNAAPAAFGGFTVARTDGACQRFRVATHLRFALLIPDYEVRTADARRALPKQVPFPDAVRSAANSAAIAAAFASRNYAALTGCFADFLHQPSRARLVPGMDGIIAAGVKAGALGGWLSGSGSTIACLTLGPAERVAAAMLRAAGARTGRTVIVGPDNRGVVVTED
ncbi:MAG: homoserine kinase [Terrimicrobiaceae bacterium]|nr:homoserine kinase [Terrimicrobiaceae bacterium]